jgi:hypothetical protein
VHFFAARRYDFSSGVPFVFINKERKDMRVVLNPGEPVIMT